LPKKIKRQADARIASYSPMYITALADTLFPVTMLYWMYCIVILHRSVVSGSYYTQRSVPARWRQSSGWLHSVLTVGLN